MQQTETGYNIVKGNGGKEELEQYRLCFLRDGVERTTANLNWLHHENLLHKNEIYYAMQGLQMAAIYTALPVIFRINGVPQPALQSIDTLTDKDHRGKGLFIKLANNLYKDAAQAGFKLIYGFPNPNSAPGFYQKLQWHSFGEVPFLLKPLNPFYLLKKAINRKPHTDFSSTNYLFDAPRVVKQHSNSSIQAIDHFGADYDEIWNRASADIKICADRSAAYMNWRYIQKPGEHYYRYGLYEGNKLTGVVVFSIKHKHGGLVGTILELVFDPSDTGKGKQLLKLATKLCKKQKVDVMLAWSLKGCFNYAAYKKAGYFSLPEKIRPQKLYLGVRVLESSLENNVLNLQNWYISYSDSDTA
ncbi:MAG: GNAT family N-acetyltransferase [Bacteroidetes bacterium]|nr:GNAT family N-acetyltransferase [Bacteroidota bacterium]